MDGVGLVVVGHQEVGHGEEGGVHHPGAAGEDEDGPLGPGEGETDHPQGVNELPAHVHRLGPEPGHHLVQEEGVEGAGEAVHAHAPAGEPHALVIRPPPGTALGRSGVPAEHGLAHEVGEVEAVADERAPAEEVG